MSSNLRLAAARRGAPNARANDVDRREPLRSVAPTRRRLATPSPSPAPRASLVDFVLAVLLLVLVGMSYGAFAVAAFHSARSDALQVSDFNTIGGNPWQTPFPGGAVAGPPHAVGPLRVMP